MAKRGKYFRGLDRAKTLKQFKIDARESAEHSMGLSFWKYTLSYDGEPEERKEQKVKLAKMIFEDKYHFVLADRQAELIHNRICRLLEKFSVSTVISHINLTLEGLQKQLLAYDSNEIEVHNLMDIPYIIELFVRYELYLSMKDILSNNEMNKFEIRDYAIILFYLNKNQYIKVKSVAELARIGAVLYNALPMISIDDFRKRHLALLFREGNIKLFLSNEDIVLKILSDMDGDRIDDIANVFREIMKLPKIANEIINDYTKAIKN